MEDANAAISFDVETHTIIYEDKENHTKKELPSINKPLVCMLKNIRLPRRLYFLTRSAKSLK